MESATESVRDVVEQRLPQLNDESILSWNELSGVTSIIRHEFSGHWKSLPLPQFFVDF